MNGNGGGEATGKPCAGCVGAADNKNPPGQFPDGTDANNGYECDGNSGVGKTNPAHTGCMSEPYSGASVDMPDKDRGRSPKNRLTGYERERPAGASGGTIMLGVLGLAVAFLASRVVLRFARR